MLTNSGLSITFSVYQSVDAERTAGKSQDKLTSELFYFLYLTVQHMPALVLHF